MILATSFRKHFITNQKHSKFGIVPELASREHENTLNLLTKKTIKEAKPNLKKLMLCGYNWIWPSWWIVNWF